jgi:superfamily II DNA or RNA helicase
MAKKKTQIITSSDEEEDEQVTLASKDLIHQLSIGQENLEDYRVLGAERRRTGPLNRLRRRARSPSIEQDAKPIFSDHDVDPKKRYPSRGQVVPFNQKLKPVAQMQASRGKTRETMFGQNTNIRKTSNVPENLISFSEFKRGKFPAQSAKKKPVLQGKFDQKPSVGSLGSTKTKKDATKQLYVVPVDSSPSPVLSYASSEESLEGFVVGDRLMDDAPVNDSDSSEEETHYYLGVDNMISNKEENDSSSSSSSSKSDVNINPIRDEIKRMTRSSMTNPKYNPSLERSRKVQFQRDVRKLRRIRDDDSEDDESEMKRDSSSEPEKRRKYNKFILQETQAKDDDSAPSTDDEDEILGNDDDIAPYSDDWIKRVSERLQRKTIEEENAERLKEEMKGYNTRSNPHRFDDPISNLDEYDTDPEEATDEEIITDDEKDPNYMEEQNIQANIQEICTSMEDARLLQRYQQRPAELIRHNSRNKSQFTVYGPGTGKTLAGLYLINQMMGHDKRRFPSRKPFKWLILLPAALQDQWQKELDYQMLCNVVIKNQNNVNSSELNQALENLIQYQDRIEFVTPNELRNNYQQQDMHRYYIMVDEVQEYGYRPSSVSKSDLRLKNQVVGMIASSKSCFLMSATPLQSRITEMATYFWMLHLLGSDVDETKLRLIAESIIDVSRIVDPKFREQKMRMMWDCFFLFYDVERQDPDLPRKRQVLRCKPFTEDQWKHYYDPPRRNQDKNGDDSDDDFRDAFSWEAVRRCITDQKLEDVTELTMEILAEDPTSKILIASKNVSSTNGLALNRLLPYFDHYQIQYFDFTVGASRSEEGKSKLVSFNEQRNVQFGKSKEKTVVPCRVAMIGPKMSTGTDFKRVTHLILLEPQWNEQLTKQQIGRAVRMKSHRGLENSRYYNMVMIYRCITVRPEDTGGDRPLWQRQLEGIMTDHPDELHLESSAEQYTIDQRMFVRGTILAKPLRDFLDQLRNMPLREKCLQFMRTSFESEDLYKDSKRKQR